MKTLLFIIFTASVTIASGTGVDGLSEMKGISLGDILVVTGWVFTIAFFLFGSRMNTPQSQENQFQVHDVPTLL